MLIAEVLSAEQMATAWSSCSEGGPRLDAIQASASYGVMSRRSARHLGAAPDAAPDRHPVVEALVVPRRGLHDAAALGAVLLVRRTGLRRFGSVIAQVRQGVGAHARAAVFVPGLWRR